MPLTLAHAAAAPVLWWLARRRLVLSAVVVGAMSPDFEYLLRLAPQRTIGHTPLGVAVFCVPASLVVLAVWHRLVGPAFAPSLPGGWGAAAGRPFRFGPASRFVLVGVSAAAGAFSHIAWDAFTHGGPMVTRHGLLSDPVWAGGPDGYLVAWWVSSIVGVLVVAWWLVRLAHVAAPAGAPARSTDPARVAVLARPGLRLRPWAVVAAGAAGLAAVNATRLAEVGAEPQQVLIAGVLGAMAGTAVAAVAASAVLRSRSAR